MTVAQAHELRHSSGTALEVKDLTVQFGGLKAVDGVDMSVDPGSVHALIGPNGAGKTTLLNAVNGLVESTAGTMKLDDEEIQSLSTEARRRQKISRTFQNPSLMPDLSVVENVALGLFAERKSSAISDLLRLRSSVSSHSGDLEKAVELLNELGLGQVITTPVAELPLGVRKLVDLARAFISAPRLLLLDEPTAGIGVEEAGHVQRIVETRRSGATVVLVAHHIEFVMAVADVVTVLHLGRVVASGSPESVRSNQTVVDVYIGPGGEHA